MLGPAPYPIARLNNETLKALKSTEVIDSLKTQGSDPAGSTPEELATMFKREVERYAKIIKAGNIQAE